ncbi:hypothetical protein GOV12_06050 [Candidatus Pacearchaeota archaeon]|nr:hypothetical protein [Candidatus Pacearchaeota archaeon]
MIERSISELEKLLKASEDAYLDLFDVNKKLEKENSELQQAVSVSLDIEFLKYAAMMRYHQATNKSKIKPHEDYVEWEKGLLKSVKRQCSQLTSLLFRKSMETILDKDERFNHVPFFYHDFYSGETIYTPGVLNLFNIRGDDDKLSIKILARLFVNEKVRTDLDEKLKKGHEVKNHIIKTSYGSLDQLSLNAYPLTFGNDAVGFGAFLYNPKLPIDRGIAMRFGVYVRRVTRELGEEFKVILGDKV